MMNKLMQQLKTPEVFKASEKIFWKDPHIAKYLLQAHLNPNFEGASRNPIFIDKSVRFITSILSRYEKPHIIDLGCGPGLYCERLTKHGFHLTGVDFSRNSIDYAKKSAKEGSMTIHYRYENYLQLTDQNQYDMALLIYCDYGALDKKARQQLLHNIKGSLKQGGQLLLDVFTDKKFAAFHEEKKWSIHEKGGFWSPQPYIELSHNVKYENNITLEHTVVMSEEKSDIYYIWNQYFTKETIQAELKEAGFIVKECYSDVTGKDYDPESETLAVLVEK